MKCTLPELEAMLKRAKIEHTTRICPVHRVHEVRNGKLRDDLRIDVPEPGAAAPQKTATDAVEASELSPIKNSQ